MKKKNYWVEVDNQTVVLRGRNLWEMRTASYFSRREATQMAKRLAAALNIDFRE